MTIVDPIPAEAPYGVADWKDYKHNWREVDTDWIQDRSILRFSTATQRDAKLLTPQVGQFIYNNATDLLEYRSKTGTWKGYKPAPLNMDTVTDTASTVKIAHVGAGSKGLTFSATGMSSDTTFAINGGILTVTDTAVTIKTGAKTVALTTSATDLVIDSPITIPGITLSGSGTVVNAAGKTISVGTLSAASVSSGSVTASGNLTGGSLTVGNVSIDGNAAFALGGYVSQAAYFYGGGTSAVMRYRDQSTGGLTGCYIQADSTNLVLAGNVCDFYSTPRVLGDREMHWYGAAGFLGYTGPVIYSGGNLSASNYPNGTIWISP